MILDGGSPGSSAMTSSTSLASLSGRSCGSTTTLTALCHDLMPAEEDANCVDSSNNENINPNRIVTETLVDQKALGGNKEVEVDVDEALAAPRRGVKRRSLTETGEMVRPLQVNLWFD